MENNMQPEILLVRHDDGYHILHGHLRLINVMSQSDETYADASGEGKVRIIKTPTGMLIDNERRRLPLIINS